MNTRFYVGLLDKNNTPKLRICPMSVKNYNDIIFLGKMVNKALQILKQEDNKEIKEIIIKPNKK